MCKTECYRLLTFAIVQIVVSRIPVIRTQKEVNAVSIEDGAKICQGSEQTTGCTIDHETGEETWKVIENLRDIYKEDYPVECPSKLLNLP